MSQTKAQLVGGVGVSTVGDLSVYGGVNATGVVTATSFSGDGSQLTGIDSTALKDSGGNVKVQANTSGIEVTGVTTITNGIGNVTIGIGTTALLVEGNARITGILTVGTGSITFDGTNNTINVGSGVTISASTGLTGSGANLTSLNASNLGSGTVPDARFPATLPSASGANLTSLNASNLGSGTVPDDRFPATLPSASGANLTSLNASNLGSGTVPTARLASGTANSSSYLRGDQTWASISSGITISDDTSTNAVRYLTFTSDTSGTISAENVSSTKLTYNPSLGVLKANKFDLFVNADTILGQPAEGGILICKASSVGWIVAPSSSEVGRNWYNIGDANTRAQEVSGCTGWFVPTCGQLQNPGYACRNSWDSYYSGIYWSSTESNPGCAWRVRFTDGNTIVTNKNIAYAVRSFRCVTY